MNLNSHEDRVALLDVIIKYTKTLMTGRDWLFLWYKNVHDNEIVRRPIPLPRSSLQLPEKVKYSTAD
jgi:hypothetical protein